MKSTESEGNKKKQAGQFQRRTSKNFSALLVYFKFFITKDKILNMNTNRSRRIRYFKLGNVQFTRCLLYRHCRRSAERIVK